MKDYLEKMRLRTAQAIKIDGFVVVVTISTLGEEPKPLAELYFRAVDGTWLSLTVGAGFLIAGSLNVVRVMDKELSDFLDYAYRHDYNTISRDDIEDYRKSHLDDIEPEKEDGT